MIVNIPEEYAEEIEADIGTDDPAVIGEQVGLLWVSLNNSAQLVSEVKEEVPAK